MAGRTHRLPAINVDRLSQNQRINPLANPGLVIGAANSRLHETKAPIKINRPLVVTSNLKKYTCKTVKGW